jgi:hypothetical protein
LLEAFGAYRLAARATPGPRAFALGMKQRDGYVTRVFGLARISATKDMQTGQLAAALEPSDAFSLTLRGDYTKEDENGSPSCSARMN